MNSRQISSILKLAGEGNDDAYGDVIAMASERLTILARRMLAQFPRLQRWEQTDDIVQNASIRLHRSLMQVRPVSMAGFVGLASTEIRRTLIDLARHHFGPEGNAANHRSDAVDAASGNNWRVSTAAADRAAEPVSVEGWTRFHESIDKLPDEEREVFELIWFTGLEQNEIAEITGLSVRTVKRRWRAAKLKLYRMLEGVSPLAGET